MKLKDLTKPQLENLYLSKDNKEICKELGITNMTLVSYLDFFKIAKKGRGNRKPKAKFNLIQNDKATIIHNS